MKILRVDHISKEYPGFLLQNVSFAVEEGTIMGFIGRNGAGKTTTLKSILNMVPIKEGTVEYFGLDLKEHETAIKQRIGYAGGAVEYYKKRKIRNLIDITKRFYNHWDDEVYRKYMKMFSLDENKTPSELSEGMKVKLNLVIALSHGAELLILDEPTSGLDPFSRDELLDIFMGLRDEGVAVFFSTHIISDLEKCADDIIYISRGKIQAAMPQEDFRSAHSLHGETLEQTILRLEKEIRA